MNNQRKCWIANLTLKETTDTVSMIRSNETTREERHEERVKWGPTKSIKGKMHEGEPGK